MASSEIADTDIGAPDGRIRSVRIIDCYLSPLRRQAGARTPQPASHEIELARETAGAGLAPVLCRHRPGPDGIYEIIARASSWLAAHGAGLSRVPAVVVDVDDETALQWLRADQGDPDPITQAEQFEALRVAGWTHAEIGARYGLHRTEVAHRLALLRLAPDVQALVRRGLLKLSHARRIARLDPREQRRAAARIVRRGQSVRAVEASLRGSRRARDAEPQPPTAAADPNVHHIERLISERLGAPVRLDTARRELRVSYIDDDCLAGILERLGISL